MMRESPRYSDELWVQTALLIFAFVPVCLLAYAFEQRTYNGINLWIKPLKFQISAVVHLLTLYLISRLMSDAARRAWFFRVLVWASCIATAFEIFIITLRASQGAASHFNYSTPMDAMLYGLMGVGAVTMLLPAVYLSIRFMFRTADFKGGRSLHFGVSTGFLFASILTLLFAGYMSANGSHWTSGQNSDLGGLPIVGWSQTGGDLRPAHFFALHLMQLLPLIGYSLDRFSSVSAAIGRVMVIGVLLVVGGLSVFTFCQALDGKPFLRLGSAQSVSLKSSTISDSQEQFWQTLSGLCGQVFKGQMTYPTAGQDDFAGKTLVAHVEHCGAAVIKVPFAVGEDQSRTWVFTKTPNGIQLKHDHRHNGYVDEISDYGGWADDSGTSRRQAFPADAFTARLIPPAATNVWNIIIGDDGKTLTYHLERNDAPRFTAALHLAN